MLGQRKVDVPRIGDAVELLLQARQYAKDTRCDPWEFAIEIERLRKAGVDELDLRWLVKKGFVKHAREVTVEGDNGRQFRPTGDLTFSATTCVVLTDVGASSFGLTHDHCVVGDFVNALPIEEPNLGRELRPVWDADLRRLQLDGHLVKWFKWRAANQEIVLSAFEEEGWPLRIDDPLSPHPEQDTRRRLSDTIKCLNQKQTNELIRFHGDGTGEGVTWELTSRVDKKG